MTSRKNDNMKKPEELKNVKDMGPNWIVIVGGALLCTLSIRLCCRLKQVFNFKSSTKNNAPPRENGNSTRNGRHEYRNLHSQLYCVIPDEEECQQCCSVGVEHTPKCSLSNDGDDSLPLVKVTSTKTYVDNGVMWASPGDRLELPPKPLNPTNSSNSPCLSESGSDIHHKGDVVQKLRQQLRRRDDMLLEMQAQITVLQNSLAVRTNHNAHLRAQLDSSNQDLFDSDREIKWLQKTISGMRSSERAPPEAANGDADGSVDADLHWVGVEKVGGEDRVEVLNREIQELKEVIEGKEFLIQSYREQKIGLCSKLKELQARLVSQASAPHIL